MIKTDQNKQLNDKDNNNIKTISVQQTFKHSNKWEVTKVILPNGLSLYIKSHNTDNDSDDDDHLNGCHTSIVLEDSKKDRNITLAHIQQDEFLGDKGLWDQQDTIREVSVTIPGDKGLKVIQLTENNNI